MNELFYQYGLLLVRRKFTILSFILLFSILCIVGIVNRLQKEIPVDFTPQAIFMDNSEEMLRLREIEDSFGREDNDVIIVLKGDISTPETLSYIKQLHTKIEALPFVEQVQSLYNAASLQSSELGPEVLSIWDSPAPIQTAQQDPFLVRAFVSEDGTRTLIRVRIERQREKVSDLEPVIKQLINTLGAIPPPSELRIYTTGVPHVRTEVVAMMLADNITYAPILTILFFTTICVLFRNIWLGIAPLLGVLFAVLWSMGILLGSGVVFNVLSILVPILALIIGVADGIHLVSRYREECAKEQSKEEALAQAIKHMFSACFLTTFTTATGFLSLIVADTVVIRDFGVHSSVAVMTAFFAVILVVPCYLSFLPSRHVPPIPKNQHRFYDFLHRLCWEHPTKVVLSVLLICACAGVYGSSVRPNSHLLEMYHPKHPTHDAIQEVDQHLSGIVPIFIHIEAKEGDLLDPIYFQKIIELEKELKTFPWVRWTYSLPSHVLHTHTLFTQEKSLPQNRELIEQELLVLSFSDELPLEQVTQNQHTQFRILALCQDAGGTAFIELHKQLTQKAKELFPDDSVHVDVTGDGLMASLGINQLITDLLYSIAIVVSVIFCTLLILLRDIKLSLISLLPNVIPLLFTLATLRLIGADLQTSNIVSFTVSIGLAVDDTIHFVVRYKQERSLGRVHKEAMLNTFRGAGQAIILTSLLLVSGFGVLATSSLTSTYHFGLLASITLGAAILADLLLLPAAMNLLYRREKQ
jgi:predicted RND superfamily exporter protein